MGWTVLYIAFGIVALWLLGEVLLQYKARLRWRLLAFSGFLCVVVGALLPSVVVIGVGIAAFATGQTFVTLSYRRGFSAGWALGGMPGSSRRRREEEAAQEEELEPLPKPGEFEVPEPAAALTASGGFSSETFEMSSLASNGYGANGYGTNGYDTAGAGALGANGFEANGYEANPFDPGGYETRSFAAADASLGSNGFGGYDTAQPYDSLGGYQPGGFEPDPYQTATNGYGAQQSVPVYQPGPLPDETGEFSLSGYDTGYPGADQRGIYQDQPQQQYAAYSDPYYGYDGNSGYSGTSFDDYDNSYGAGYGGIGDLPGYGPEQSPYGASDPYGTNGYGMNGYGTDGYGTQYDPGGAYPAEQAYFPQAPTGGGGVWVPQQRDPNDPMQQEQPPYPYQNGDPNGYGAQGNGYYY